MRKTHHSSGKGRLGGPHIGGKKVREHKRNAPDLFAKKPKSPEADNVGRKLRPAAHNARQKGVAKRTRAITKRLSDQVI
jgi:hypothetical protein